MKILPNIEDHGASHFIYLLEINNLENGNKVKITITLG